MKIGLISDIHGDLEGLERALAFFQKQAVDEVLCAGDLVDGQPDGDAVVGRIRALKIPCVQGNHDALSRQTQNTYRETNNQYFNALSDATVEYLLALPYHITRTYAGIGLTIAHANLWNQEAYIHHKSSVAHFHLLAQLADASTRIIMLGHSHIPMVATVGDDLTVINPGSVYSSMPYDFETEKRNRRCAILTLPSIHCTFYDVDTGGVIEPFQAEFPPFEDADA